MVRVGKFLMFSLSWEKEAQAKQLSAASNLSVSSELDSSHKNCQMGNMDGFLCF